MSKHTSDLKVIEHYLTTLFSSPDCIAEIDSACESIAKTIENLEARVKELEGQVKVVGSAARHAANVANCLASGITPD